MQAMREMNGEYIVECVYYTCMCVREREKGGRMQGKRERETTILIPILRMEKINFNFEKRPLFW